MNLTKEEKELLNSVENGEWQQVPKSKNNAAMTFVTFRNRGRTSFFDFFERKALLRLHQWGVVAILRPDFTQA